MKNDVHPARVLVKALCLFLMVNLLYAWLPVSSLKVSAYNVLFPGRTRLPFGITGDPYTVTVNDVDAMFTSHRITVPKAQDEYRVVLIGDSSVWGEGLGAYEVLSEQWNQRDMECGSKTIQAYDLGYPHPSVVKDLVLLDEALRHEPDLVIWFVTLNTLISQRANPFLVANQERTSQLVNTYEISFKPGQKRTQKAASFFQNTLIGQRSNIARWIKLQLLGIVWTATGADTDPLARDEPSNFEINENARYRGMEPPEDITSSLLLRALSAGHEMAGSVPILLVNEPMFIIPNAETRVRYNGVYPRWAYDQYREALAIQARHAGWKYLDLWDALPPQYFLDAGLHPGHAGQQLIIERISPVLRSFACTP